MIFEQIIYKALTLSGLCAFTVITGRKFGVWDWLQGRTPSWLPWGCNFCLGFWFSIMFSILAFTLWVPFTWPLALVPVVATAFNNTLLK